MESQCGVNVIENGCTTESEPHVHRSVQVIEHALSKYGMDGISISFNGGKDCTVLLHLVFTVIQRLYPNTSTKLKTFFVDSEDEFEEIIEFVKEATVKYNLEVFEYKDSIKDSLATFLKDNPSVEAIFLGPRRSDSHYTQDLKEFQVTDGSWPRVMRVHPILDWSYMQIWEYLRSNNVPYCSLYDQGYTSLGAKGKTKKNAALKHDDGSPDTYYPAYMLKDETSERTHREDHGK